MPYSLTFQKSVEIIDPEQYFNDCCIGGDVVLEQLLPTLNSQYCDIEANQEDWGWFAWFEKSGVKLAVDIFTDDQVANLFQIHLTSRKPRLLFGTTVQDTPELEELRQIVEKQLNAWPVDKLNIERVNNKYFPVSNAT
ncbi:hypothetical protein [Chitinibacter sp. S2-10]|uniref:hypothetical protein n=1 Tax=Chitinibacter sp. S2-10 TaxID=3373597 RepID=UPI0039773877